MSDSLIGISMHDATSVGVLQKQRGTSIRCLLCSSVQCKHAMCISQWPLDDPDIPELLVDFLEQPDVSARRGRNSLVSPVSLIRIPFDLSGYLRQSYLHGPETTVPEVKDDNGNVFLALLPPINDDPCEICGSRFRNEDPRDEGWCIKTVKLFGKWQIFNCFGVYYCNSHYKHII